MNAVPLNSAWKPFIDVYLPLSTVAVPFPWCVCSGCRLIFLLPLAAGLAAEDQRREPQPNNTEDSPILVPQFARRTEVGFCFAARIAGR